MRKKVEERSTLLAAFEQLGKENNLSPEMIKEVITESFVLAYRNRLCHGDSEANARVVIDENTETLEVYGQKVVVDDCLNEYAEILLSDAKKVNPKYKLGDIFEFKIDVPSLSRSIALYLKQQIQQKLREAEKKVVYDNFIEKKDEIIVATVDRVEDEFTILDIGHNKTTYLKLKQQIPGDTYYPGLKLQVYVSDVTKDKQGAQIFISRTHPNFLKRLMEREITDISDGTVVIENIARYPGLRAKVAVYSTNPNVDPVSACIGSNSTSIGNITGELHGEKIDVIYYYKEPEYYIIEALKPAQVIGIKLDEENKSAVAVVINEDLVKAIGKRHSNNILASRLTGYNIEIVSIDQALEQHLSYMSLKDIDIKYNGVPTINESRIDDTIALVNEEEIPNIEVNEEVIETKVEEIKEEETKTEEVYVSKVKNINGTHISVIEETKEEETKTEEVDPSKPSKKALKKEAEALAKAKEEEQRKNYMPIYTDEELKELEAQEDELDEDYDDVDYEDYEEYYK